MPTPGTSWYSRSTPSPHHARAEFKLHKSPASWSSNAHITSMHFPHQVINAVRPGHRSLHRIAAYKIAEWLKHRATRGVCPCVLAIDCLCGSRRVRRHGGRALAPRLVLGCTFIVESGACSAAASKACCRFSIVLDATSHRTCHATYSC